VRTYLVTLVVNGRTVSSRTQAPSEQVARNTALTHAMLDEWDRMKAAAKVVGCVEISPGAP